MFYTKKLFLKTAYAIVKLNSVSVGVDFVEVMLSVSAKKGLGQNLSEQVQIILMVSLNCFPTVCTRGPVGGGE